MVNDTSSYKPLAWPNGYGAALLRQRLRVQVPPVVVSSEIAQGGFSFVYRARDTDTGEPFALKKILCQTDEQVQLAKAEIQAHKAFAHPNIMPLNDYAVVSSGPETFEYYLLFPFMENGTLREMINTAISQDMRIPEAQILDMFLQICQICRAVAELHSKSPPLAHRDIKPENVMLSDEGEPLLTDFGSVTTAVVTISKRSDALMLQERAAQHSSMAYRAPELYDVPDNTHISSATDVWSLGCLLYAMAFGYSPFECSFYDSGVVRVVECTYLAVIGPIKFPKNCSYSPRFSDMIRWILTQDATARRPYLTSLNGCTAWASDCREGVPFWGSECGRHTWKKTVKTVSSMRLGGLRCSITAAFICLQPRYQNKYLVLANLFARRTLVFPEVVVPLSSFHQALAP